MFSRFFIARPIFAAVLSILITLGGGVALFTLPVAQYPEIAPPTVEVTAIYPGANAQVVADTVAAPIEQQVNGVENMMYMSSQCTNDGTYTLTVTFKLGTDLNIAQVLVQNRVSLATPILPSEVQRIGISVKKKSPSQLMIVNLYSPDGSRDSLYLSNYATIQLRDELSRLPGVGDITYLGQRNYSMRVWLDPKEMASRNLSVTDIATAINDQNAQVAAGQIGQPPAPSGQQFQYTITTLGRLSTVEQFRQITVKSDPSGRLTLLKDVARIELGAQNYDQTCTLDGQPSVALSVYQLPGSNALETSRAVQTKMKDLRDRFPTGVEYSIVYDTTPFITESINEVFKTLRDAVILVAIVVLLFLQNWRSALIPLVAVPVAVIGTFGVMALMGFSLNNLTLFGLVLAIGIVVDDAIVVVEAVEHHMELGLAPREATEKALDQVSGPVIAVGLVLAAVFVPCAFIAGISGQFFRQFALTIAVSTLISAFNSLTLSPALAALLMKPRPGHGNGNGNGNGDNGNGGHGNGHAGNGTGQEALPLWAYSLLGAWLAFHFFAPESAGNVRSLLTDNKALMWLLATAVPGALAGTLLGKFLDPVLRWLFRMFNNGFNVTTNAYTRAVGGLLRVSLLVLVVYGGLLGLTWVGFKGVPKAGLPSSAEGLKIGSFSLANGVPTGFIPSQDKGYLLVNIQLPDAASLERTEEVVRFGETLARFELEKVESEAEQGRPWTAAEWQDRSRRAEADGLVVNPWKRIIYKKKGKREGVNHTVAVAGQSLLLNANAPNFGAMYVMLDPFEERVKADLSGDVLAAQLEKAFHEEVPAATMHVFGAPPVEGLGTAGGFKLIVEDRGNTGLKDLQGVSERLIDKGNATGQVSGLYTSFRANTPWLYIDYDRKQGQTENIPFAEVGAAMAGFLGSLYVNDFNLFGRTWQVNVQADRHYRSDPTDLKQLKLKRQPPTGAPDTGNGNLMVPAAATATVRFVDGPVMIVRYNMYQAAAINGTPAPGVSSGEAIEVMEKQTEGELPPTMRTEWTELALLQLQTGSTAIIVFCLAVVLVFLVLAAQYESWSLPLAVILVVPMCLLCSIAAVALAHHDVNIFTQIGFVVLVGLACKNAILIVEFAKKQREAGVPRYEATLAACKLRLRPILMTSFAFILGVVPLVISEGAGAEMRRTLGTAVFGGMLGVTLFGVFLTPVFFYVIQWYADWRAARKNGNGEAFAPVPPPAEEHPG